MATSKKKDPRAATSRTKGAVGSNPLVYRVFRTEFRPDCINSGFAVLDYGAGKDAVHTQKLRLEGYANVWAFDLEDNMPSMPNLLAGWAQPIQFVWSVVLLSNVLNVQRSRREALNVLKEVKGTMAPHGTVIANYPDSPRMSKVTVDQMYSLIDEVFDPKCILSAAGTRSAPCWLVEF